MASLDEGSLDDCRFRDSSDESHTPPKEKGSFLLLFIVISTIFIVVIMIMMVTQHIPTAVYRDKIPPWWEYGSNGHGVILSWHISAIDKYIPNSMPLVNSRFHAKVPCSNWVPPVTISERHWSIMQKVKVCHRNVQTSL